MNEACRHKFVDSKFCLLCGWAPPPREPQSVERSGFLPLATCIKTMPDRSELKGLVLWLSLRPEPTISVGFVDADETCRCSLRVYEQTFFAVVSRKGCEEFQSCWHAILGAVGGCEDFERSIGKLPPE